MSPEPDRQLWCAVISQAIDDAACSLGKSRSRNMEIIKARDWLAKFSRDFDDVCLLAGYEPDRIRAQVTGRIEQAMLLDCPPPPKVRKPRAPRIRKTNTINNEGNATNVASAPL